MVTQHPLIELMIKFLDLQKITDSFRPDLNEAIDRVIDSGYFVKGREVREFEEAYAAFIGSTFCVGTGNGFDALRLIFKAWIALGYVDEGDEVIVPANTYIASILSVSENRLTPILVEPDAMTFNIDAAKIAEKISPRTKAIMVVHLYGRNGMTSTIEALAEKHGLRVVEDNAQAAGCRGKTGRTGALAHAAAHSFFPSKNLGALGDGGAVTTDDALLADMVRTLGNYGSHKKGINPVKGINSRLDELQAAVLNVKLPRLDEDNNRRRMVADFYRSRIHNRHIMLPVVPPEDAREHVWHLFVVRCAMRDHLQAYLKAQDIETLIHYPVPPHKQKSYSEFNHNSFPLTEQIHREVLSLPLSPVLEQPEMERVVEVVNAFPA